MLNIVTQLNKRIEHLLRGTLMGIIGWENNPNGICEDAPCCGCCGPHGDGVIYDDPPEYDDYYDDERWQDDDDEN